MKKKILITTGGSGGHVVPAKIISDHLRNEFEIILSTDRRGHKYFNSTIDQILIIDTPKLNINFLFPIQLIKILFLTIKSIYFLKKKKINKVISIGGYMSIPICLGARLLQLKIYLLEPNLVIGRANKFFLRFAEKIICYSHELKNFPKRFNRKIKIIKPLVGKQYYEEIQSSKLKKKFTFLVVGGSQGANIFDDKIKEAIVNLSKTHSIKIIQQTSLENSDNLKKFYSKNKVDNIIFSFEKNFINLIRESDLCITRAGATTLAELSVLNIPFLAVPLPSAKDNHQYENANFYKKLDCCWILDQQSLDKGSILKILCEILENKSNYFKKKENLKKLHYQNSWISVNQKLLEIINEN